MTEDDQPLGHLVQGQDLYYADHFVNFYGEKVMWVPGWKSWYHFTGTHWEADPTSTHIKKFAIATSKRLAQYTKAKVKYEERQSEDGSPSRGALSELGKAGAMQNAPRIRGMIELASADERVIRNYQDIDANPYILPCKNGILDLRTRGFRRATHLDLVTRCTRTVYKEGATAPKWDAFLQRVLPDAEVRGFIQRFFGYCLTGDVGHRIFVVLYGSGANGKSVFLDVLKSILGSFAVIMPPALLMSRKQEAHPTEVASLAGARVAISSEVKRGRTFDEEVVKRLTGNDALTARRMHENFWEFAPTHKLIMAVNHRPRVVDTSEGFWDRVTLVSFGERIPEHERVANLQTRLIREESAGILNWALEGLAQVQARDGLDVPASVRRAVDDYRTDEDRIGHFLAERCERGPGFRVSTAAILGAMKAWAAEQNMFVPPPNEVRDRLQDIGCKPYRTEYERGWVGIRLAHDEGRKH